MKRCPAPDNHETASKKQNKRLLTHAEDFKKDLKLLREEHQKRVSEGLCLCCERRGITPGTVKPNFLKQRQKKGIVNSKLAQLILKIKFLLFLRSGARRECFQV